MNTKSKTISLTELLSLEIVLPVLAFMIPFLISGPQLLTGTIVNCFLFLSATHVSKKNIIMISLLPSIGALLNGVVFGVFTPFLFYFLPFIWISNLILVITFKKIQSNVVVKIGLSSVLKFAFLFVAAQVYFSLHLVPKLFLTAMGIFQLITALLGGLLFIFLQKFILSKHE
ncbi:MAG: hypothetical protein Q7R95_09300 [bacterium]|nr:hypothetical protein [bacterium]